MSFSDRDPNYRQSLQREEWKSLGETFSKLILQELQMSTVSWEGEKRVMQQMDVN